MRERPWQVPILRIVFAGFSSARGAVPRRPAHPVPLPRRRMPPSREQRAWPTPRRCSSSTGGWPPRPWPRPRGTGTRAAVIPQARWRRNIADSEITPNVYETMSSDDIMPLEPEFATSFIPCAGTQMVIDDDPEGNYPAGKDLQGRLQAAAGAVHPAAGPRPQAGPDHPQHRPQGPDSSTCWNWRRCTTTCPRTRSARSSARRTTAPRTHRRSTPSLRWTSTLQSGQLDASSTFVAQAVELHLPYIKLPSAIDLGDAALASQYAKATVTIKPPGMPKSTKSGSPQVIDITIDGTPTPAGEAFVSYTLSAPGLALYKQGGFTVLTPTLFGPARATCPRP